MRVSFAAFVVVVAAVAIAGCGSAAAPTPTLAPGATPAPTQAPVTTPAPTQAPGVPTQTPANPSALCAGQPTYNPEQPLPSFAQDETLNARFPTQIDGQPVTVQSSYWLQSLCFYGSSSEDIARFVGIWPPGTAGQISLAFAHVELDGNTVDISAMRIPGGDPNQLFSHIPEFIAALGGDPSTAANTTVSTTSLGGKNVYVVTQPDGAVNYDYVSGDAVFSITDDATVAAKVFAAIP